MTTPLRAVKPGERAPRSPRKPQSVAAAAKSGSPRALLVAQRDRIASAIDDSKTPAAALAALLNRMDSTVAKIEAIDATAKGTKKAGTVGDVEDGEFDSEAV